MSEFFQTFQFVLTPFLCMVCYACVTPTLGSALYLRNEMLLCIALTPLTTASLIAGVVVGIDPHNHLLLLVFATACTFLIIWWFSAARLGTTQRQMVLASFFAGGSVMSHLLLSISHHAHAHMEFLLSGELLSIGIGGLRQSIILAATSLLLLVVFRNALYAYCIDEKLLKIRLKWFWFFMFFYRLILVVSIVAAVYFIGPLLTLALLIFPPLFTGSRKSGIAEFFALSTLLALFGSVAGFCTGVALDIPPAYTAAIAILPLGFALRLADMIVHRVRRSAQEDTVPQPVIKT